MDELLGAFLESPDQERAETQLGDLLTQHAEPVVRRVVHRRLGRASGDADDVCSQVLMQLMQRLRRERIDASITSIDGFLGYVAIAAHHGCDHYVRAKYPLRWRLRNRIRYVLDHDVRFAVWKSAAAPWLCGLAAWRSRPAVDMPASVGRRLANVPHNDIGALLLAIFGETDGPAELSAIVDLAADAWGVPLFPRDESRDVDVFAAPQAPVPAALQQRERVTQVWAAIGELPVRQRHALLLNMKDDAIALFVVTGVASLRTIAAALELPVEQLAAIWSDLPLSDNALALRLGCSRQQVINLRMSARKRLVNQIDDAS